MSLSKKAEEIYQKLSKAKFNKDILITEEEFNKAISQKQNNSKNIKTDNIIKKEKQYFKLNTNFESIKEDPDSLNSIKIQKSELENLFNKKNNNNSKLKYSEINIVDKLLSNTKIFLKNLIYIQNEKELFDYLDKNLSTSFYFKSYYIFLSKKIIHSFNIDKNPDNKIINLSGSFPDQFENNFSLLKLSTLIEDESIKDNYFIFPIFFGNENLGYIFLEADENYSKNEYYLDFIALLLSLIPSFIPSILPKFNLKDFFPN